jgi:hypothetical protein
MKRKIATIVAFCCFALVFAIAFVAGVQAQAETIKTRIGDLSFTHDFANGYPSDATVQKLFDEMDFQRAVQASIHQRRRFSIGHGCCRISRRGEMF